MPTTTRVPRALRASRALPARTATSAAAGSGARNSRAAPASRMARSAYAIPPIPATLAVAAALCAAAATAISATPALAQEPPSQAAPPDPYLWLEEVEGERALGWAVERSNATLAEFEALPVFGELEEAVLEVIGSADRIAYPSIRGDHLYNFWTDSEHPRGVYRRTTWDAYLSGNPEWEVVLDIDAIAEDEGVSWAYRGMSCLEPEHRHCLVSLSRGGADATETREFDLQRAAFVEDGFFLPEAKGGAVFVDSETLLVATDFGDGTLTTSGYPRQVRRWKRGRPLDEAEVLYEAPETDMIVSAGTWKIEGRTVGAVSHAYTIFERTIYLITEDGLVEIDTPSDASTFVFGDQLVVRTVSEWSVGGQTFAPATVVAMNARDFLAGERDFTVVAESGGKRVVQWATATKDRLLVGVLDNVQGELWRYARQGGEWTGEQLPSPGMGSVSVAGASDDRNQFFFTYSSFTQPSTLYLAEEDGAVREVRRMPDMFVSEDLVAEQHHAQSADGTEIPFFVVHKRGVAHDGSNPTLLTAYGGFQIPRTASYNSIVGKAWMERGGVYVLANIRGGGEFGPAWWTAALKENRQRAYDDFLAVAQWLVDHGLTSPAHLGIQGGSNGGLLVGAAMTQRPDLFNAVVSQVPLLDMRRYHKLLAGASWMAEYGNPDDPNDWAYISKYSPYQNIDPDARYPRALFTTTTRDDRVHPGHARKMAAKMTEMGHDVLYFENTEGGHGAGVTPAQRARMYALIYAYLWTQLGGAPSVS